MDKVKSIKYNGDPYNLKINNRYLEAKTFLTNKVWNKKFEWLDGVLKDFNKGIVKELYIKIDGNVVTEISLTDNSKEEDYLTKKRAKPIENHTVTAQQESHDIKLPKYLKDLYVSMGKSDNYALTIDKFGRFEKDKLDYTNGTDKRVKSLYYTSNYSKDFIDAICSKQTKLLEQIKEENNTVSSITAKQTWRMATGMGKATAYNNGFNFHPVFGVPYLTAQQIKGMIRSFVLQEVFFIEASKEEKETTDKKLQNELRKKRAKEIENNAMADDLFCYIFGSDENASDEKAHKAKVHFMECFPVNNHFKMALDIMNPHYGDYYNDIPTKVEIESEKIKVPTPPADYLSPTPIFFLSVKGMEVQFSFWIKEDKNISDIIKTNSLLYDAVVKAFSFKETPKVSALVEKLLTESLQIQGIGAKTAVGYGRFQMI